jgi:hypothetical protein
MRRDDQFPGVGHLLDRVHHSWVEPAPAVSVGRDEVRLVVADRLPNIYVELFIPFGLEFEFDPELGELVKFDLAGEPVPSEATKVEANQ